MQRRLGEPVLAEGEAREAHFAEAMDVAGAAQGEEKAKAQKAQRFPDREDRVACAETFRAHLVAGKEVQWKVLHCHELVGEYYSGAYSYGGGGDDGGNGAATVLRPLHHEVIDQGKDQKGKAVMEIGEHGVASADAASAFARRSFALLLAPLFALRPFLPWSPRTAPRPALRTPHGACQDARGGRQARGAAGPHRVPRAPRPSATWVRPTMTRMAGEGAAGGASGLSASIFDDDRHRGRGGQRRRAPRIAEQSGGDDDGDVDGGEGAGEERGVDDMDVEGGAGLRCEGGVKSEGGESDAIIGLICEAVRGDTIYKE